MKAQPHKKPRGERIIEIIAVVIVIVIVAIIVIPNLTDRPSKTVACEASPISCLRTYSSAQELYKTRNDCYGDYFNLYDGKKNKYIDPALAKADPDHPQHQDKSGYNVDVSVNADNTDWCAIAYPGTWGKDDYRNFKITSEGIIYYNTTEGDTTNFTKVLGSS